MKIAAYGICYGQQEQAEHITISRSQRAICALLDRQCAGTLDYQHSKI